MYLPLFSNASFAPAHLIRLVSTLCHDSLTSTYLNQGRLKEAKKLQMQVTEASKRVLGAERPSTLTSMVKLALTYWNQGLWKEAEELQVQVTENDEESARRRASLNADLI